MSQENILGKKLSPVEKKKKKGGSKGQTSHVF